MEFQSDVNKFHMISEPPSYFLYIVIIVAAVVIVVIVVATDIIDLYIDHLNTIPCPIHYLYAQQYTLIQY